MTFDLVRGASKEDLIATLSARCSEYELVGNTLWGIKDDLPGKIIVCFSLASTDEGWGYKEFTESQEPYDYSCPLRFLSRTPPGSNPWRQRVRAFHASRASNDTAPPTPAASHQAKHTQNVIALPVAKDRDLIQKELSRLLNDYDTTSLAAITAEYEEDEGGVHFESIKFEFNTLCMPPFVPPSPELLARTLDAFTRIFARLEELSTKDTYGSGHFQWDLLNDHLENHHTTHTDMVAPQRDLKR